MLIMLAATSTAVSRIYGNSSHGQRSAPCPTLLPQRISLSAHHLRPLEGLCTACAATSPLEQRYIISKPDSPLHQHPDLRPVRAGLHANLGINTNRLFEVGHRSFRIACSMK